jgi:hypothetical protein
VLNSITGFTTLQPYISFIISENINLSLFLLFVVLCCKFYYTSSEDKAELVPKFLGQAREFLTDLGRDGFVYTDDDVYFMFL